MKPTPVRRRPETWYCEECDQVFVLLLEHEKSMHCNTPHHCHYGDLFMDREGRQIAVVASDSCLPYSTTE